MKHKWTLFTFSRGDFKTLERYLNEQAEKGWELERVGILARWKRTERTDLVYNVDLSNPKQDVNDRKSYADLCTEAGWELTAYANRMYIFKSLPHSYAIPIHTDPELERKNYNRYYIRSTILSVVALAAYLAFWLFISTALGNSMLGDIQEVQGQWMTSWLSVGLNIALPLWAVWAVWKLIDFVRAAIKGRTGSIGESPRWVLWMNCIMALAAGVGAFLFYAGMALEFLLIAKLFSYVVVMLAVYGIVLLFRAFEMEGELFKGERRRYVKLGIAMILVFALLIVGRVLVPYGRWDTNPYSADEEAGENYALLEDVPIVRGEDIGLPLDDDARGYFYLTHELTPVGEHWKLENYYYGSGLDSTGCETYTAPTVWLAERLVEMKAEKAARSAYLSTYSHDVGVELEKVEIEWADEAWYGELKYNAVSVLVVRIGKQVTYLSARTELMEKNVLAAIESRLRK